MGGNEITKLAFLADSIAADPSRISDYLAILDGSQALPQFKLAPPSAELADALAGIRAEWASLDIDSRDATLRDVVELARLLRQALSPWHRAAGEILFSAAESRLARASAGGDLDHQEAELLTQLPALARA